MSSVSLTKMLAPMAGDALLPIATFEPEAGALPAREALAGRLHLAATRMRLQPARPKRHEGLAADPALFPAITVELTSDGDRLSPLSEQPIRGFADEAGGSYWDVLVQPGRIWSLASDAGWSRAAFPFALVNPLENETYNGLALFGFREGRVTPLTFQIMQQTVPFLLLDHLVATGVSAARFEASHVAAVTFRRDNLGCWPELAEKVGADALAGFDAATQSEGLIASGIDLGGRFHLRRFDTLQGTWPYPDETRLGVWSVTKSAMTGVAALRLAERYGDDVLHERITDHVPELDGIPAWQRVTFGHALGMATGVGSRTDSYTPLGLTEGDIAPGYKSWYLARSLADKIAVIAEDSIAEDWAPGTTFRYRDQDIFTVGLAMDRFARARTGKGLRTLLHEEVFAPLDIRDVVCATTCEAGDAEGLPLWAFGFYPTIDELMRIARLLHNGGRHQGQQILSASLIRAIFVGGDGRGVATDRIMDGEAAQYFLTFWCSSLALPNGRRIIYPKMLGYGGNEVLLLPNGVTMLRIAKDDAAEGHDTTAMAKIGLALI